jgi:hypothetical protein
MSPLTWVITSISSCRTLIFHELLSRDHEDGRATRSAGACAACRATVPRYRGIGSEADLNGTSQGELVLSLSKEHPRMTGRTAILYALAALRSVPQAGSQFRGRSK